MKQYILFVSIISLLGWGCASSNEKSEVIDTPTAGEINLSVDETLQPISEALVDVFHHQYPNAKINIRYRSEAECVRDLYNDSSKLIISGRQLTLEELEYFKSKNLNPPHTKIATDAVALVANPKSRDTTFNYAELTKLLKGQNSQYNIVFDNQNSGTVSHILSITGDKQMPTNAYAAKSNLEAVNYVATHEKSIGVIGWSWISDSDDPKTKEYLSKIRLVSLAPKDAADGQKYKPYQLNLAQGKYPLSREVFIIQRLRSNGLSAGFNAFVISEIGQTIILKAGLLPAYQQERQIEMNVKPLGKVKSN